MKEWFKFFGLSFFSHKISSESSQHGFTAIALGLLLAFVFFLFGYYGADVAPFGSHYDRSTSYKAFVTSAFGADGVTLFVNKKAANSPQRVNTYASETDREKYAKNGYNLIVDTRPSETLVRFSQVAERANIEISYEDYLALNAAEKAQYTLKTVYTDEELTVTPSMADEYKSYFESVGNPDSDGYNADASADYTALTEKQASLGETDYNIELYYLYVKHYYTSVKSVIADAKAPVLRDYYYRNYVKTGKSHYFFVFDDMCAGSFETDGGVPIVFGGYYTKCKDGAITNISNFIKDVYYDTAGIMLASYFMSAITLLPSLILIPILIGILLWLIGKAVKNGWDKRFASCFKTVSSFVWMSALITSVLTFICGFFASAHVLYSYISLMYAGILLIRTAVFCIISVTKKKSEHAETKAALDQTVQIFPEESGEQL